MAKLLGVDIGSDSLKLALVSGGRVEKTFSVPSPRNLMHEGRVVSTESAGALLRSALRESGIRAARAAVCLPNEAVYVRTVTMPVMTVDQLRYNLPYEFNDYITDDPKSYVFDYAMLTAPGETVPLTGEDGEADERGGMELMAVAAPGALLDETRETLRHAGLRLAKAAPAVSAYISLIRRRAKAAGDDAEYCMLDLGSQSVRMYMFRGERHIVTRVLEQGLGALDAAVAAAYDVDSATAHGYFLSNYENCQEQPYCRNIYGGIAVELMRAMNFYRFSNPDSRLTDVWLCGGGAQISALRETVASTLDMALHPAGELLPSGAEDAGSFLQAIGITMD